ncbi:hypothetical protein Fot_40555 [Forsythia ovata]|uniref:PB1-like domain-containing protein n=1 Tax=Forsythia ovata TaxID=205694 RepID=A0ABD1S8S7_9LAMI
MSENSMYFTNVWHHGGRFYLKSNNLSYEHGQLECVDFVDPDDVITLIVGKLDRFLKCFGYKVPMEFFYRRYRMSLLVELVRMKIHEDLKRMLNVVGSLKVVEVYMVSPTPLFSLPWDSPTGKGRTSVIITEISESDMIREPRSETFIQPESQPLRDYGNYVLQSDSHECDNVDWENLLDRKGEGERHVDEIEESKAGEDIGLDQDDILVDSDYEMDEGSGPHAEPTVDNNVNIDIGFGYLYEGSEHNSDSDYEDSDELDSFESE